MENLNKILDDAGMLPILQRRFESKSNPGTYHIVSLFQDGHIECGEKCIAGQMKRVCRHQRAFVNWILKKGKK